MEFTARLARAQGDARGATVSDGIGRGAGVDPPAAGDPPGGVGGVVGIARPPLAGGCEQRGADRGAQPAAERGAAIVSGNFRARRHAGIGPRGGGHGGSGSAGGVGAGASDGARSARPAASAGAAGIAGRVAAGRVAEVSPRRRDRLAGAGFDRAGIGPGGRGKSGGDQPAARGACGSIVRVSRRARFFQNRWAVFPPGG